MQGLPQTGVMAAATAGEEEVRAALSGYEDRVAIAAVNGAENTVISGEREAVEEVLKKLGGEKSRARLLDTSHAFHSPLMEPILPEFERCAAKIEFTAPKIPLISNVSGNFFEAAPDASYWTRQLREPVRFSESVERLGRLDCNAFVEIGPSPTLLGMAKKCMPDNPGIYLPSLRKGRQDWQQMLRSLAALYVRGAEVDWQAFDAPYSNRLISLPTYPFERKRYWIQSVERGTQPVAAVSQSKPAQTGARPLLGMRLASPLKQVQFECGFNTGTLPYLSDHKLYDTTVLPAAAYLEMMLEAATELFGPGPHSVIDFSLNRAIVFSERATPAMQLVAGPVESGVAACQIFCLNENANDKQQGWELIASSAIRIGEGNAAAPAEPGPASVAQVLERLPEQWLGAAYYQDLREHGFAYGASFQAIEKLNRRPGEALGEIQLPQTILPDSGAYLLHPVLLDSAFQLFAATLSPKEVEDLGSDLCLPTGVDRYCVYGRPAQSMRAHFVRRPASPQQMFKGDIRLMDETGKMLAEIEGLSFRRTGYETVLRMTPASSLTDWLYEIKWRPQERGEPAEALDFRKDAPGTWLICVDEGNTGTQLLASLQARGQNCVLCFAGDQYRRLAQDRYSVVPAQRGHFERLLQDILHDDLPPLRGIVHLWGLPPSSPRELTTAYLKEKQAQDCGSVLNLLHGLARLRLQPPPRLWMVTRGAQPVADDSFSTAMASAPLWGMGSTIALENPELHCTRVDLPVSEEDAPLSLLEEIYSGDSEDQVAFRRGERYVRRLVRSTLTSGPLGSPGAAGQPFRLEITERGSLDQLVFRPVSRRPPAAGEVEIRVHATGLNFRDVMTAMAVYPGGPSPLGGECSGKVVACGEGITDLHVGDEVIAIAPASFAMFVTVPVGLVVRKPASLSFEEGAAIPIAFLTAYHALHDMGKVSPGDTVLVHAAAGGVGVAAIQIAQRAGAKVIGTAGSPAKREFLASLGVHQVGNSRSLDFADEVMACTGGRGVDIVLNSLAGDFIARSLSVLAPGGRFVEMGKTGIWQPSKVEQFRKDISYFILDLVELCQTRLALIHSTLSSIVDSFAQKELRPLPLRVFPIESVVNAYRFMAQAKHIGKIVISQEAHIQAENTGPAELFHPDRTYLITGGSGELGLLVARWMVENGARHLALIARHSPSADAARELSGLEKAGAQVLTWQADVSDQEQMANVMGDVQRSMPPLRGVIHAAGVLDDGLLAQQEWARFEKVLAPKVEGAWNLHTLTLNIPLDFFVLFSSAASILGSPAQGNYAAANAFLDALAHYRTSLGLAAISMNWAAWEGIGMAAKERGAAARWAGKGIGTIEWKRGLQALALALRCAPAQLGVMPVQWPELVRELPALGEQPFLAELIHEEATHTPQDGRLAAGVSTIQRQVMEASPSERLSLLRSHIRGQVVKVLGLDPAHAVDVQQPLSELGLDSLMAVELMNTLGRSVASTLPATILYDYPTIESLAYYLATQVLRVELSEGETRTKVAGDGPRMLTLADIEQLSEEEAALLLKERLAAQENGDE
jgi:acyl transferase domain-containing protein/acyl carrier protein